MTGAFERARIESPRLCAELLLSHVIGCERIRLYTDVDRPAAPMERDRLRDLTSRALRHEPVQYLVGEAWFFSLPFHVDRRVLIPRPSTETIVEAALQHARVDPSFERASIGEVGIGSGCVSVALLKNLTDAHAAASDVDAGALEVARLNAERHGVLDRIDLLEGDLLAPLERHPSGARLDLLVSNPPYIPDHEWADVEANVKDFEPERALRGGEDGLRFVRPLLERGPERLRAGGMLAIEIAASTAEEARRIAEAQGSLRDVRIERDADGLARVVVAFRR
jgi:release factor glutamine methyltransferase